MTTRRMLQALVAILGVVNVATGLALLLAPEWFFENVGHYPPFNRHYEGDLGAFILAVGVGLVWAVRDPRKYRALIGIGLLSTVVHVLNHVYDDLILGAPLSQIMSGVVPVSLQMLLLGLALYLASARRSEPDEL